MRTVKSAILALLATSALLPAKPVIPEFHYTVLIAKSAADVWSALTEKKTIDRYYMVPVGTMELKKGGKISY
jgi:uncharacterized protein YndB with AHSA1/START domain